MPWLANKLGVITAREAIYFHLEDGTAITNLSKNDVKMMIHFIRIFMTPFTKMDELQSQPG